MDWLAILLFFLLLIFALIGETIWLVRRGWAKTGRAAAYAITSNLLGLGMGLMVILVILLLTFMMAFGPAGTGSTAPEWAYWAALIVAITLPLALLVLSKRVFLAILKIGYKNNFWAYSMTSSILTALLLFLPPSILFYVLTSIWTS